MPGKILIVEDDVDIARLLGVKLRQDGHEVAFADDAVTALTITRKEDPDLFVIDLGLPGGGGLLIMERLQAMAHHAMKPVIVISAREPVESEQQARAAAPWRSSRSPSTWTASPRPSGRTSSPTPSC